VLETPHVVVAAAIAYKLGNPLLAIPISFASHFVFDKVPHWNPHISTEFRKNGEVGQNSKLIIACDVVLALIVGIFISSKVLPDLNHAFTILAASFFGVLPDLIEAPYFFGHHENIYLEKWVSIQKSIQTDTTLIPGLLTQILTVLSIYFFVLR
jgi:hypothetical protein